ncbi:MAG TPA: proton-conducting transporter membrane subunit [Bacteroidia bacterium]|nr:proton-conducting transporter membrane subunit [Bacteroidia bacterium]
MILLLHIIVLIPLLGFVVSLLVPKSNERWLSRTAVATFGLQLLSTWVLVGFWVVNDFVILDVKDLVLFETPVYQYFIDLHFDEITAVYAIVGSFLSFLVAIYSRVYMHRESGFKRFFNTIQLLFVGYTLIIFSGNLETLFIGWEFLGISSFLLIAFYRNRYLPVRNAFKVYSLYRLGDVGLILAMWLSHHLFHENITFKELADPLFVSEHLHSHTLMGVVISLMILLAAAVKSAQLPFSSWLPRAMEGPTPSSAIFYGSLSVHLGVFILLRTFPFWEHQLSVRILIGVLGFTTSGLASGMARVQSAVKSQIAYASIAQIGLIFIEVAMGWEILALVHFAGNAFLRTYQLLVSPSVVSYLIREQFYNFEPRSRTPEDSLAKRIMYSLYMLCLKEWGLDQLIHRIYREPLKRLGRQFRFMNRRNIWYFLLPSMALGMAMLLLEDKIPGIVRPYLPAAFALVGLIVVLRAFVERRSATMGWYLVMASHFWVALAISFNEHFKVSHTILYLSGILVSGVVGIICLQRLRRLEQHVNLDTHQGHSYEHDGLALVFLLACLGMTGFPITPSFIGEDLIFSHIHENQIALAAFCAVALIIDGLAVVRIYTKIFMGTHIKGYHESAYRSS